MPRRACMAGGGLPAGRQAIRAAQRAHAVRCAAQRPARHRRARMPLCVLCWQRAGVPVCRECGGGWLPLKGVGEWGACVGGERT